MKNRIKQEIMNLAVKYYNETIDYLKNANLGKEVYNKALQKAIESYRITNEQKIFLRSIKR